ncbi:hypothetical protein BX600DRAFT_262159 [Xylariales sp. PMI_506]|nr:hypothetical protein BX600DRAFT_262159 [Xylariales sp. PMI_506]
MQVFAPLRIVVRHGQCLVLPATEMHLKVVAMEGRRVCFGCEGSCTLLFIDNASEVRAAPTATILAYVYVEVERQMSNVSAKK